MEDREISILVIDDEPLAAKSLMAILQAKGFSVRNTSFGKEGLDWMSEGFQVVILDLKLPDIDGVEVLRRIKKSYPETIVIMVTGFATVDTAVSVMKQGAYSYFTKPFDVEELLSSINTALSELESNSKKSRLLDNLSLLYQISKEMEGVVELNSLSTLAAQYFGEVARMDVCAIIIRDQDTSEFFFGAIYGVDRTLEYLGERRFRLDKKMHEQLVVERNAVLIPQLKTPPDIIRQIPVPDLASLFLFPLSVGTTVVGLVLFAGRQPVTLSAEVLERIATISQEVARCIENATRYLKLKQNYLGAVTALVKAIEEKSFAYKGNSEAVAEYAAKVAQKIKLSKEEVEIIRCAALLHDIGKIAVSEQILLKKEALSPDELVKLKLHSIVSTSIVRHIDTDNRLVPMVLFHHERYDGSGYPEGLRGAGIPIGARILSVCDAYTAMTTKRPYRQILSSQAAMQELRRCSGTQFDPDVVETFIGLFGEKQ